MYERILVPVDGSETSKRGLAEAARLAREQGRGLRCLHVVDEHFLTFDCLGIGYQSNLMESMRENGRAILEEASERVKENGVPVECVMRDSGGRRVSDTILEEARTWGADLIVMGTHGRRGLSHLALGSDAELVVRESPVPVLLVRIAR
jgi:nucleotide-binding universal stress UspA family protein